MRRLGLCLHPHIIGGAPLSVTLGRFMRAEERKQKPQSRLGCLVVFVALLVLLYLELPTIIALVNAWPPAFIERRTQREQVLERIQSAGGWQALQRDSTAIVEQNRGTHFVWFRGSTNPLPPSVAALKPREVRFFDGQPEVVEIKVFGYRSTDGHQPPYFGLRVISGAGADSYKPKDMRYELVTNNIYEIYR
jgi:hypothetical protein